MPFKIGLLVIGQRQEPDDGFISGNRVATPRRAHIGVRIPGEELVTVIRQDDLDQPGWVPDLRDVSVKRDLLPVLVFFFDFGALHPCAGVSRLATPVPQTGPRRSSLRMPRGGGFAPPATAELTRSGRADGAGAIQRLPRATVHASWSPPFSASPALPAGFADALTDPPDVLITPASF